MAEQSGRTGNSETPRGAENAAGPGEGKANAAGSAPDDAAGDDAVPRDHAPVESAVELEEDPISTLEAERKRFEDLWLRTLAELDNYRKRVAREQEERERRAAERVLRAVLEIQDGLDKALASERDTVSRTAGEEPRLASFYRGVELIHQQIAAMLVREGVTVIEADGVPFDPRLHEAAMQVEADGCESDTVVEVLQKGYLLGDRLLRPARVTVAR